MINRKYRQNTHSNGPESRTSKINRRIRPSHMHGMDPLHEVRPSALINHILAQWLAFTDDYPKPISGSKPQKWHNLRCTASLEVLYDSKFVECHPLQYHHSRVEQLNVQNKSPWRVWPQIMSKSKYNNRK